MEPRSTSNFKKMRHKDENEHEVQNTDTECFKLSENGHSTVAMVNELCRSDSSKSYSILRLILKVYHDRFHASVLRVRSFMRARLCGWRWVGGYGASHVWV